MPTINLTRAKRHNEKRDVSVFTTRLKFEDLPTSGDVNQVLRLPANSLVTNTDFTVITAFDSATSATLAVGFDGAGELMASGNLKSAAGTTVKGVANNVFRNTGGIVTLTPTYSGATTKGEILITISYIEVEKVTGHITSYVG